MYSLSDAPCFLTGVKVFRDRFRFYGIIAGAVTLPGGHYNPAVSCCLIRGAISWKDFVPYITAQFIGGALGALLASYIVAIPVYHRNFLQHNSLICEFLFTFALCYTVLNTATSEDTKGNSYFGLAIGSIVIVGLLATSGTCY